MANLGYMSGALKHAFDVCDYPRRDAKRGRPFGVYLHGIEAITTGRTKAAATVVVSGKPGKEDLESCWELGATVAAQLMG